MPVASPLCPHTGSVKAGCDRVIVLPLSPEGDDASHSLEFGRHRLHRLALATRSEPEGCVTRREPLLALPREGAAGAVRDLQIGRFEHDSPRL
jgi:hypothetical protein